MGSLTKITPAHGFLGGKVYSYREVPFPISYHDSSNDIIYTTQIDADTQYRFRDAANLIRKNAGPIVDKTSADMLIRYPDLALDMPRNQGGVSTNGTLQCKTDLSLLLEEFCKDIENGGNFNTVNVAKFYLGANDVLLHIRLQVFQSVYAHERLGVYMKEAITGDLSSGATDDVVISDWGITNDAGGCANVKTAIDTLITTVNDIIAPTDNDFKIAADRLYFNRKWISEESTGATTNEFTYTLGSTDYQAFAYPTSGGGGQGGSGEVVCQRDLRFIIEGIISDLQTGGNNSTITAMNNYLTATKQISSVEKELLPTTWAIEHIKFLAAKAIKNLAYSNTESVTGEQYQAQYTTTPAWRDSENPTTISNVVTRMEQLVDIAVGMLAPGNLAARKAGKNILYNANYYKEEITTIVNAQFGAGSWTYNTFIDDIITNNLHDLITTDITNKTLGYEITLSNVVLNFKVGEQVNSSGGGYATVLEFNEENNFFVVGPFTGTAWKGGDTLEGTLSGAVATIAQQGVATPYDWYSAPGNVRTLGQARLITSNIAGETSGVNLYTNPEAFEIDWTGTETNILADSLLSPDGTFTAEKLTSTTANGEHTIHRNYNLSAYDTFDDGNIKWDTSNQRFDEGFSCCHLRPLRFGECFSCCQLRPL